VNPVSPIPALAVTLIALAMALLISRASTPNYAPGRFASIDGLRGYLALGVFLHHSCIWYYYLRTGQWRVPPSNLYTHLGQTSVSLFFMITSFLFYTKVLESKSKPIDWGRLYLGRVLRLVPLYLFVIGLLVLIVALLSGGAVNESPVKLAKGLIRWLTFTVLGAPNLNGVSGTYVIVAGVTWSLPYEWFFYLCLPLLALTTGRGAPLKFGLLGIVALACFWAWQPKLFHLLAFFAGIVAAALVRVSSFRRVCSGSMAGVFAACLLIASISLFETAYHVFPLLLTTVAFCLIAGGNTLFGALASKSSRVLGEMTYSLYLLHGIALFVIFTFLIGRDGAKAMSALMHWTVVLSLCPALILACHCTFRFIERPALGQIDPLSQWIRTRSAVWK
jgi:peptidoglycan/LPS O-acetylase OafA/YrhL